MVSKKVTVKNPTGLHLRPAGILCNEAMKYQSQITFVYDGGMANAKSVLSVLGACVKCGNEIELTCEGVDEQEALDHLVTTPSVSGEFFYSLFSLLSSTAVPDEITTSVVTSSTVS